MKSLFKRKNANNSTTKRVIHLNQTQEIKYCPNDIRYKKSTV
jgi:hypothetical protein